MRMLVVTLFLTIGPAGAAWAQSPVQVQVGPSTPSHELGVNVGLWSLTGEDNLWGGRYGRRATEWLVAEWSFDKSTNSNPHRDHLMVMSGIRLQTPATVDHRRLFMTAGIAAASGLSYSWSPVIGFGGQTEADSGAAAFRLEIQIFTRAKESGGLDQGRLMLGISIGLPDPD